MAAVTGRRLTARARVARAAVLSLLLVGVFVWLLGSGGFPLVPPREDLRKLELSGFALCAALMLLNMLTRFARCHFLIAPLAAVPFWRIMTINAVGMAAITFLPLRLGEVVRPALLREKVSGWSVTGTVGAERIIDGVVFSTLLLLGLAVAPPQEPLPDRVGDLPVPVWLIPRSAQVASALFIVAFLVMAAFYWYRAGARRITERVLGLVSARLARRVADVVERLSEGLRFLTLWRYSVPYVLTTLVSVMCLVLAIEALAHASGLPELAFSQALVVLGVLALGFSAPNAPGFFGVVQLALYAGLATYIAPDKVARQGGVVVFVYYATYLATVVVLAALGLVLELWARHAVVTPSQPVRSEARAP